MILVPYPNPDEPRALLNIDFIIAIKIESLTDGFYLFADTENKDRSIQLDGPFNTYDDAQTALYKFYNVIDNSMAPDGEIDSDYDEENFTDRDFTDNTQFY